MRHNSDGLCLSVSSNVGRSFGPAASGESMEQLAGEVLIIGEPFAWKGYRQGGAARVLMKRDAPSNGRSLHWDSPVAGHTSWALVKVNSSSVVDLQAPAMRGHARRPTLARLRVSLLTLRAPACLHRACANLLASETSSPQNGLLLPDGSSACPTDFQVEWPCRYGRSTSLISFMPYQCRVARGNFRGHFRRHDD